MTSTTSRTARLFSWIGDWLWVIVRGIFYDSWFFTLYQPLRPYWRKKWNPFYLVYFYILFGWCRWRMDRAQQESTLHWLLNRRREGKLGELGILYACSGYYDLTKYERWVRLSVAFPFCGSYFIKSLDLSLSKGYGVYIPGRMSGMNALARGAFHGILGEFNMHQEQPASVSTAFNTILDRNSDLVSYLQDNIPRGLVVRNIMAHACLPTRNFWILPLDGEGADSVLAYAIKNTRAKCELWHEFVRCSKDGRPFMCHHQYYDEDEVRRLAEYLEAALPKGVTIVTYFDLKKKILKGQMRVPEQQEEANCETTSPAVSAGLTARRSLRDIFDEVH